MRRAFLAAIFLLAAAAAWSQDAVRKPTRILFIGNTLVSTGDLPSRVAVLARDMGRPTEVQAITRPDFSLRDHRVDGAALAEIGKGGWDFVVLQQDPVVDARPRTQYIDEVKRFAEAIRKAGAKPAVLMPWPRADSARDFTEAIRSARLAAEAADALLIPAGEAWLRVMSRDRRVRLYSDGVHAAIPGVQLNALAVYLVIFPAGPQEFTEAFIRRGERSLAMRSDQTDLFFDAVTLAIDEPMALR